MKVTGPVLEFILKDLLDGNIDVEDAIEQIGFDTSAYQYCIDNREALLKDARERGTHEVFFTVRDGFHYVDILRDLLKNGCEDTTQYGFTEMIQTKLLETGQPVKASVIFFIDMPEGFDPIEYGKHLDNL